MARRLLFAEVASQQQRAVPKKVSERAQSMFLNCLDLDVRYLYSGGPVVKSLDHILTVAFINGIPFAKAEAGPIERGQSDLSSCQSQGACVPSNGLLGPIRRAKRGEQTREK